MDQKLKSISLFQALYGLAAVRNKYSRKPIGHCPADEAAGNVKKKRQIWFSIFGIGLANFSMGLAIYYGIAVWVLLLFAIDFVVNMGSKRYYIQSALPVSDLDKMRAELRPMKNTRDFSKKLLYRSHMQNRGSMKMALRILDCMSFY